MSASAMSRCCLEGTVTRHGPVIGREDGSSLPE